MAKYKCKKCGYIYNPQKGDPDQHIIPGIDFDQLPQEWICPICSADKSFFIKGG
jgi:rubredoxin